LVEGELDESEFILGENTSIGRSPSNDIVLKESKISRQHASINFHNGNYVLVDLKSSNGVYVNGKKVEEAALKDGDEVSVGSFKFQFNLA
jgi:pSer/pThr/pTyr-binding forkhead associated (FHA) protein